jgi:RimJ/RimL family protein N-acetyltransferase
MDADRAREIARWQYPPPYDIYNLAESEEAIAYASDPRNNFYAMEDQTGDLVGFCSFGEDGQVPGGDYTLEALDIGLGLRPNLTGRNRGSEFVQQVLGFAQQKFDPSLFRVTIAAFNQRAQRVWGKAGFQEVGRFLQEGGGREFVVLVKGKDAPTHFYNS